MRANGILPNKRQKQKKMEIGIKVEKMEGWPTLVTDTNWEGKTIYYIGLISLDSRRRFHRIKISKRDWEKLKKISDENKTE